jgi:hypothetical protein
MKYKHSLRFLKNYQIPNLMKIRLTGAELFHADIRTDRYDEANTRFSKFCESAKNAPVK